MNYLIATFSSRNETLAYARLLANSGLQSQIINTPASISGQGCSISVRMPSVALALAQRVMLAGRFQTFRGFYAVAIKNGRQIIQRI